jgi:GrpB-like predicted nucleotidyltransferase (UPF0157 family)
MGDQVSPVGIHPLWRPFELADLDEVARTSLVGKSPEPVVVVEPDPTWPAQFEVVAARIRTALGDRALSVDHIGSTSVPDLWAKPVIDVDLVVEDSAREEGYVPDLEAAGFVLRAREPDWQEHRVFRGQDPASVVHVWSPGSQEPARHRVFRDWLRTHDEDRAAYGALKTELGTRGFTDGMDYNNHKAALVYDIYERIFAADPEHAHTPRPRGSSPG